MRIRELDETTCRDLLGRQSLGRLAFSFRDRVDIQPLNFVVQGDWIFGRTSRGRKVETIRHHRWVAFQVDEITAPDRWVSVVVYGPFHLLNEEASPEGEELARTARAAIRRADPRAFTEADPAPNRDVLFGIALQEVSGLAAVPAPSGRES